MSLKFKVRENLSGKYVFFHANELKEGVEYALKTKVPQIQIRGPLGMENQHVAVDFKELEKLAGQIEILSLPETFENVINLESIYSLVNLREIDFEKQKYNIDVSKFAKLERLGVTYWKGLLHLEKAHSLKSLVLLKFPNSNLTTLSELGKLTTLHIYSSKIETLSGIEELPIKELTLARNNQLEDITAIEKLKLLKIIEIEKCKKITDFSFINSINNKADVRIIR